MQADAAAGRIRVVVVPKMDRFARDVILCLQTYDDLRRLGVLVVSVAEPLDFDTPMGRKFLTDAASTAEWYSRNLGTEVDKGLSAKFRHGGWIGPLPLGYASHFELDSKGERIKGTGRAIFSEDIATVRLIFELYSSGNHSDLSIAEYLNSCGLTTIWKGRRVPFQKDTVKTILLNRFYLGFVTYHGEERPGAHEAAIDRDLWDCCQAIRMRRSNQRGGTLPIRGVGGLLSELIYCGKCGARMHTLMCGEGESRQRYYRCSARRSFGKEVCDAKFVPATWAEQQILDLLRTLTIPPTLRDAVIAVVQKRLATPVAGPAQDMAKLVAQMERLKELYELGDVDKETYLKRRKQLQDQIAQATPAPSRMLHIPKAMEMLSGLSAMIDAATAPQQQRAVIQQILSSIWIEKGAVTAVRPAPNYILLVDGLMQMWFSTTEPPPRSP